MSLSGFIFRYCRPVTSFRPDWRGFAHFSGCQNASLLHQRSGISYIHFLTILSTRQFSKHSDVLVGLHYSLLNGFILLLNFLNKLRMYFTILIPRLSTVPMGWTLSVFHTVEALPFFLRFFAFAFRLFKVTMCSRASMIELMV